MSEGGSRLKAISDRIRTVGDREPVDQDMRLGIDGWSIHQSRAVFDWPSHVSDRTLAAV